MKTSVNGLELIKKFEGFSGVPYICPAGLLTIGFGHVIHNDKEAFPLPISKAQADQILRNDIIPAERAVDQLIVCRLNQNQFDALVSFTYNLGAGSLQRSTLRQVINRGEHNLAPAEFQKWVYGGGCKLSGLVVRRHAEAMLYSS